MWPALVMVLRCLGEAPPDDCPVGCGPRWVETGLAPLAAVAALGGAGEDGLDEDAADPAGDGRQSFPNGSQCVGVRSELDVNTSPISLAVRTARHVVNGFVNETGHNGRDGRNVAQRLGWAIARDMCVLDPRADAKRGPVSS
jgi:hypothetical protein